MAAGVFPSCLGHNYIQTTIRTHTYRANLELPLSLMCTSLDCGRELECLENPRGHKENMQTRHSTPAPDTTASPQARGNLSA